MSVGYEGGVWIRRVSSVDCILQNRYRMCTACWTEYAVILSLLGSLGVVSGARAVRSMVRPFSLTLRHLSLRHNGRTSLTCYRSLYQDPSLSPEKQALHTTKGHQAPADRERRRDGSRNLIAPPNHRARDAPRRGFLRFWVRWCFALNRSFPHPSLTHNAYSNRTMLFRAGSLHLSPSALPCDPCPTSGFRFFIVISIG